MPHKLILRPLARRGVKSLPNAKASDRNLRTLCDSFRLHVMQRCVDALADGGNGGNGGNGGKGGP
jgi:hypothetical protein